MNPPSVQSSILSVSRGFLTLLVASCGAVWGPVWAVSEGADVAQGPTFAERLGWKRGDVVVVLHIDDAGMHHSSNRGVEEGLERGVATSFAIMMPCPWVPEIVAYVRAHPGVDAGVHLTLTSEWGLYRWGALSGKAAVPGLADPDGFFWGSVEQVVGHASADEVERELRAQVDRAESMGLKPTHLDSHMGTLFARPDYFERYLKVGIEKKIPVLACGGHMTYAAEENPEAVGQLRLLVPKIWNAGLPVIDDLHTGSYGWPPAEKTSRLVGLLKSLKPGITEILFHASVPTDDFPKITGSSASRHADSKALSSPEVRQAIAERGIVLTTWRELMERRAKASAM